MTKFTFKVNGLNCDSCHRLLQKALEKYPNSKLEHVDFQSNSITVDCEEKDLPAIKQSIVEKGFSIPGETVAKSQFKTFVDGLTSDSPEFKTEKSLLSGCLITLVVLLLLTTIFHFVFLKNTNESKLLPLVFLSVFGVVVNYGALKHVRLYSSLSCSTGMMTGMTVGMMSGFMLGAILGASNGMFIGSLVGMIVGIITGIIAGYCCGVMGIMEGMMAGLMAGLMGAMTGFMLISDNLILFVFVLFAVCTVILGGLSYMLFKESGNSPEKPISFFNLFIICLIVSLGVILLVLYGPKSPLAWGYVS